MTIKQQRSPDRGNIPTLCVFAACIGWLSYTALSSAGTIDWSGHSWQVRDDTGGPGPNTFLPRNVAVDHDGALHLKIEKVEGHWTCAEIYSTEKFGYGKYEFVVASRVDRLDHNVVLGLFNYPDNGPDGTNELDIEYARWGNADADNLAFTAYPLQLKRKNVSKSFKIDLRSEITLNRFTWSPGKVLFAALSTPPSARASEIATWQTPDSFSKSVSRTPMPVHLNLWLYQSNAPSDTKPVEAIVRKFTFTPGA